MRLGGVAPVPVRAHDDVRNHDVTRLHDARPGDVDRAAHVCGVRPREQVAGELDRAARGDLGRSLRGSEELDLARPGHGAVGDGLLPEPAELVRGADLLELVPVLDETDVSERLGGVDE